LKHIKAQKVLPEEIIKIIQQYVDGEYIYIPKKNDNTKAWGEKSGTKEMLKERNSKIWQEYTFGSTVIALSKEYYLSEPSIRRIIYAQKKIYTK
jgi:Mor family transcriptional regulator